ncbi:DUF2339 domain-containing protein [Microvirga brassicacearum]|uniref:DUF2339 domain-containing protein n=1 Tax=Microvirga brassicacearum TaxID=2580413 RepID=A0A5N3P932_9HYPH|nr:DUF2339 domain-containing protein [Microvirga brassicacearum]KAB0266254.1 DUF2339 domain-containing protein [Microvirga brassicacearum]
MDELTLLAILLVLTIPVCAVTALFLALGARRSAAALRLRLEALENELRRSRGAIEQPIAGESLPPAAAVTPPVVESLPPEQPRTTPTVPPIAAAPRKDSGLEDRLGSRWAVWVGGIALALGGIFLVRYSIEQNLLAPGVRVMIGLLFAAGLIGAGEWLRRRERDISLPGFPSANVPSVLTAAGTCTAFASIYAAYALYGLISPAAAFVLLGAVAVLTMAAAILHGPALAGLGLVGAMGSPLLVSSQEPQPWALVIYLPFVVLAAYGVARFRRWRWLALAAAGGALLWSPLIALADERTVLPLMVHLALQTAFAALFLVADPYRSTADGEARIDWPASLVLLLFSLGSVLTASAVEAGSARPIFAGIVALVLLATGFRFAAAAPAAAIAAFTVIGTLLVWPIARDVAGNPENIFYMSGDIFAVRPDALAAYLIFACVLVPLVSAASLLRLTLAGQLRLPIAAWYAGTAAVTPLLALVAAYWRIAGLERDLSFALAAGLLALAFVFAATRLRQRGDEAGETIRLGLGAVAAAALGALALGLTFVLDRGMLTVAFALTALATAWISERLTIPALRYAVGALGLIVLGRLIWSPTIVEGNPGPILVNWLLWGYGIPAVSFFLASRWLERSGRDRIVQLTESLSFVFATFLIFFEIRHALHAGDPLAVDFGLVEAGLIATETLAFGVLLTRLDLRKPDLVYRWGSLILKGLSLAICIGGLLIGQNPLFTGQPLQGSVVFNALIPAYLLPSLIAILLALAERGNKPPFYSWTSAILALALQLAYVCLQIRRVFQGPELGFWRGVTQGEQWSYSLALLVIGIALLGIGLLRDIRFARLASAVYLVLAVLKVFIVDLANLEGVMRALSFIGLGLVLIGIGLVYQRLLTQRPGRPAASG